MQPQFRIIFVALSVALVISLTGCAQMRKCFRGDCEDGSCGPDGCSLETASSEEPTTTPFFNGSGSDVFGGNMSSPARGSSSFGN